MKPASTSFHSSLFAFCSRYAQILPPLRGVVTVALLALASGCSPKKSPGTTLDTNAALSSRLPSTCPQNDPFNEAVNFALSAAALAQSAQSKEDWDLVVLRWMQAIEEMQAVTLSDPRRDFAQKKVIEYLEYMNTALAEAATATSSKLPFSTFNNQSLDEQLRLYLSYVAALGTPDVLIVGSSRALLGINPTALQQALATQGRDLKVYNFGVNGATAQVVDLLVRQILSPQQLPQLILWADGVRAFNGGREDKTYNGIVASPGYKDLSTGIRPTLPKRKSETPEPCVSFTDSPSIETTARDFNRPIYAASQSVKMLQAMSLNPYQGLLTKPAFETVPLSPLLTDWKSCCQPKVTFVLAAVGASVSEINSNGFLPVSVRFNPDTYYQKNPHVAGLYDADYQVFNLGGKQVAALSALRAFTQSHKISLVFINLPLTQDYLDSVRREHEQQFRQFMEQQASQQGFVFLDLGTQWLTQYDNFADPSHLNRFGAAAISHQLADELRIPWPLTVSR